MSTDADLLDALNAAKTMLANAYYWRRLANENSPWDEATALAHIHYDELPLASPGPDHSLAELQALRPFALMWNDISTGMRWRSNGGDFCCAMVNGMTIIQIEMAVPANIATNPRLVAEDVNRKLGRIIRTCDPEKPGILDLSGQAGYLPITECKITGYIRTDRKAALEIGDAVTAEIELTWGATE